MARKKMKADNTRSHLLPQYGIVQAHESCDCSTRQNTLPAAIDCTVDTVNGFRAGQATESGSLSVDHIGDQCLGDAEGEGIHSVIWLRGDASPGASGVVGADGQVEEVAESAGKREAGTGRERRSHDPWCPAVRWQET